MDEIWKDVVRYEGFYQVSNMGNVRSITRVVSNGKSPNGRVHPARIKAFQVNKYGYCQMKLSKYGITIRHSVHKIVLDAFIGECPNGLECNHIDGNKSNNRLANLEYCTRSHNIRHSYDFHGNYAPRGEDHSNAKLTEKKVIKIRALYATGKYTCAGLAPKFGVSKSSIISVISGVNWGWLTTESSQTQK